MSEKRAEAPSRVATLRLSPQERATVRAAAQAQRQPFSQFARDALLTYAEECLRPTVSTSRVVIISTRP